MRDSHSGSSSSGACARKQRPLARLSQARPQRCPRDSRASASSVVSLRSASNSLSVTVPGVTTRVTRRSTGPLAVATSPTCSAMATDSPSLISLPR
jgi:hypothetical protein